MELTKNDFARFVDSPSSMQLIVKFMIRLEFLRNPPYGTNTELGISTIESPSK